MPNATATSPAAIESDAALIALGAELAACDALTSAASQNNQDTQYDALYTLHLALREKIERMTALTLTGLCVKAMATEFALKWDTGPEEISFDGSFFDLCRSISRDILAMGLLSERKAAGAP
jgi:hypothetical protein